MTSQQEPDHHKSSRPRPEALGHALSPAILKDDSGSGGLDRRASGSGSGVRRSYGRWRAATLALVYVLMAAHIAHWKLTGRTLAPLEFNEVMHTFELGIVTAGFLFMCLATLATLVLGRFFCSWGCHILALQDLCRWLLQRLGVHPQPVRSRVLLFVPLFTAAYLFVWPQVIRLVVGEPLPRLRLTTDAEGWASFVTTDYWRNLPGPWIVGLTFLICGFVTVYLLGSRSFCTYVCPYGAVFGLADRLAVGRIRVDDRCAQCGHCTAVCTSHVRVHEEVARFGMVVNPECMKDLDCVSGCPNNALRYGIGKPALLRSRRTGRFGLPFDFSPAEEIAIAVVLVAVLLTFDGLYGVTPFFLALGLGGMIGYASVVLVRLSRYPLVRLGSTVLKRHWCLTVGGRVFIALFACVLLFSGHSAFIRYHEFAGNRDVHRTLDSFGAERRAAAAGAYRHLTLAQHWGLFSNEMTQRGILQALFHLGRFDEAEAQASRLLQHHPTNTVLRVRLGECLLRQGRIAEAKRQFRNVADQNARDVGVNASAVASAHQWLGNILARQGLFAEAADDLQRCVRLDPNRAAARAALGSALAQIGEFEEAATSLREAVRLDPRLSRAQVNLGTILSHLGRYEEAIACYERALGKAAEDVELHSALGSALMRTRQWDRSRIHLEKAVALDPNNAGAHQSLAQLLAARGRTDEADIHFQAAARLDPSLTRPPAGPSP